MAMTLPTLYHKAKGGELRQWRVWTDGKFILTEYGQVGGKLQTSDAKAAEGKNLGKKNATTPAEQAERQANSLWTHKVKRKYSETPEDAQETLPLPMLAHSYLNTKGELTSKGKKVTWPGYLQPKLDGVRCAVKRDDNGDIWLTSREGFTYTVPHIAAELEWLPKGMSTDGEIYIHGMTCQKITSLVKSADPNGKSYKPESLNLVYHVYDVPTYEGDDNLTWEQRGAVLTGLLKESDHVVRVETAICFSADELWKIYGSYMQDGYEGGIYRAANGKYLWGYRSGDLLKIKKFQDAEFEVIGGKDGVGKDKGTITWLCRNNVTDATFDARMKGVLSERKRMYDEREDYFGKMLTVRFFDRTDDQIPRFPVGVVFRDEKDLPS